jgi:hypothetical protein
MSGKSKPVINKAVKLLIFYEEMGEFANNKI